MPTLRSRCSGSSTSAETLLLLLLLIIRTALAYRTRFLADRSTSEVVWTASMTGIVRCSAGTSGVVLFVPTGRLRYLRMDLAAAAASSSSSSAVLLIPDSSSSWSAASPGAPQRPHPHANAAACAEISLSRTSRRAAEAGGTSANNSSVAAAGGQGRPLHHPPSRHCRCCTLCPCPIDPSISGRNQPPPQAPCGPEWRRDWHRPSRS